MIRLLLVSPYLCPSYGGVTPVVLAHARALSDMGLSVDVVSTIASLLQPIQPDRKWQNGNGYRFRRFGCWLRQDLVLSGSLLQWIWHNLHAYDILHTHTVFAPTIAAVHIIANWQKRSFMNTPHGMFEPWAVANRGWKKRQYFHFVERPLLKNATLQALSPLEEKNIRALGFQHVTMIPNGVDTESLSNLTSQQILLDEFPACRGRFRILFFGRLDPKKGFEYLIPAFAKAQKTLPEMQLILAGPDHIGYRASIETLCQEHNCRENVTIAGLLLGERKLAALATADLFVLSSHSEGSSMSVLEAMASGIACLLSPGCNFPESEAAGAAWIRPLDIDLWTEAILILAKDPSLRKQMGDRAKNWIRSQYDWSEIAKQLVTSYGAILGIANEKQ